jgi:hypothetical protein
MQARDPQAAERGEHTMKKTIVRCVLHDYDTNTKIRIEIELGGHYDDAQAGYLAARWVSLLGLRPDEVSVERIVRPQDGETAR